MSFDHSPDDFIPAPVRALMPYLALVLAILMAYGNIWDNTFLFDDDLLITLNSYLRDWSHIGDILTGSTTGGAHIVGGFYRPMQILLYLLIYQLGGGASIVLFHLLNLLLHIANACFMYRIGTKLGFRATGVLLATLIWALHPLNVEAVTYMSGTADPLFAFFCLWAIAWLVPDITQRKIYIILPLFLLGMASKETTVMFPLLVMACLFLTNPQNLSPRTYLCTWPLWLVTIAFSIWRVTTPGFDGPRTYAKLYGLHAFANLGAYAEHPIYRIYTFLATLPCYLDLFFWPFRLHMERSFSIYTRFFNVPVVAGAIIFAVALFLIARSCRRKETANRQLGWGILWFLGAHSPDSGILVPMNSLFLEHWMYLPLVGLLLGAGESLSKDLAAFPRRGGQLGAALALGFALFLGMRTYAQNKVWHDPESFYENIFFYGEVSARAHNNLALYYTDQGRYAEAGEEFKKAVAISDSYAETRYNMAINDLYIPDPVHIEDALGNLDRALEIDPHFYRAYVLKSHIYEKLLGDEEKAEFYRARAKATGPQ